MAMNWSYFKLEFSGKPWEDPEDQDTRYLPLEEERGMTYTNLQQNHYMNNRGKPSLCIVIRHACISPELANLIYDKVEKNQVLRIKTIKQELCKPDKEEQLM